MKTKPLPVTNDPHWTDEPNGCSYYYVNQIVIAVVIKTVNYRHPYRAWYFGKVLTEGTLNECKKATEFYFNHAHERTH